MDYYLIKSSSNPSIVGTIPQSIDCEDMTIEFHRNLPYVGKIDTIFKVPKPILRKKAKLTSWIDVPSISFKKIFDDKLMSILSNNCGDFQSWSTEIIKYNGDVVKGYNLFYLPESLEEQIVDMNKSIFTLRNMNSMTEVKEVLKFNNFQDYIAFRTELESSSHDLIVNCKAFYNFKATDLDFFRVMRVANNGYFVSGRLKNLIEHEKLTGMEFHLMS